MCRYVFVCSDQRNEASGWTRLGAHCDLSNHAVPYWLERTCASEVEIVMKVKGMSRPGGCKSTSLPTPINISIPPHLQRNFFPGACLRVQVFKSYPLCTIVQYSVPGTRVGMPGFGPEGGERVTSRRVASGYRWAHKPRTVAFTDWREVHLYFYSFTM